MQEYLAHTENSGGTFHLLREHLLAVGELSARFVSQISPEITEPAKWAGLLHDLGKYRDEFQAYLIGEKEGSKETHHAVYGAAVAFQKFSETRNPMWIAVAFCVAGHHAGLHNKHSLPELFAKYETSERIAPLIRHFEAELFNIVEDLPACKLSASPDGFEFGIRMIFSALIDSDRLDTAAHANNSEISKGKAFEPDELLAKIERTRKQKAESAVKNGVDKNLIRIRNQIFQNCISAAKNAPGFFSLTVPTGGGKTLSSMAFALEHARLYKQQRIIVVIPYLSIIEQNAKVYREIFGENVVLENHSGVNIFESDSDDEDDRNFLTLITENWDAPIVVTTSVQFIESLFAAKPSKCRKLHNIANSVVIFDEVQTLPQHLLEPLFNIWRELKETYGTSFVFSTATQPAFRKNQINFENGFEPGELCEITENTKEIFAALNRVEYELNEFQHPKSVDEIAELMLKEDAVLCVVNTRKQAFEIWDSLAGKLAERLEPPPFHLSSSMCPKHRLDVIEEIKRMRDEDKICRVVSTQLVEAGVDLDFPIVLRAVAPLDSIVQAAGRCNREGKLKRGRVQIFTPEENRLPGGIYKSSTELSMTLLNNLEPETLAEDFDVFAEYFSRVYSLAETGGEIQTERMALNFRSVAKLANVIKEKGIGVIAPYGEAISIIEEIRMRGINLSRTTDAIDFTLQDIRRLQPFMVNLYQSDFNTLLSMGQLRPLLNDYKELELFVVDEGSYSEALGVLKAKRPTSEVFVFSRVVAISHPNFSHIGGKVYG
ncbi:MAG: CRISPR-associated helicase Cas3' [Pyrinomonadaceae bacterium]